ncbi:MFS transporter [Phaeobacter italicus]|jgi:MFS family permease|uniref:Putative MFS-type transporter YcaD n=1 Tax=Phaeobacter italicus TaxID=481446 RepID=A0A0H5CYV1_9RHOB|nr:MFS transporter [Phaeobacter italicus]MBO9444060.1 MFS transporter [Phaeobacter italicus]MBY6045727.1 MFS transporter [Phaeobacter italicus]MCI5099500.1 MFS transporter [Phaeobacter italicus]CRL09708.1 putative MFS-type transporter YcaD [Phaeobacter italicus]
MRLLISFAALFLSVILLQLSTGGVGPLDAISGLTLGFDKEQIGFLGSAHFVGFFIGCWWVPRLMGNVGHSRAFAVCTALGAMGLIGHTLTEDPLAWAAMRIASGLCMAGCYTVIEAWLNAKVTNENRGRAMGTYRIADLSASLAAQLLIAVLPPAAYVSYNLLAILCCAALLPLTMTKASQPEIPDAPRLRPRLAWNCSPLAVAGVIVAALSSASFRMVGPIYGQEVGLEVGQIAFFLASFVLGGALAQYPLGWLADKYDRRWVLIWLSAIAIVSCAITMAASGTGTIGVMLAAAFFGFTTFPIFSVSAAHANDFATSEQRVELSAALMFWYALGAIASPYISSALIDSFGPPALFAYVAAGHVLLIVFGLSRMRARPAPEDRTRYVYAPRTSFTIGRLLKRARERR